MDDINNDICPRCNCCSTYWVECPYCGGEGWTDGEELIMEDPMWYSPDDFRICNVCNGTGGYYECLGHCDKNGEHKNADT